MATNKWLGTTSTNPATVTNWSLGAVPIDDEDTVLPNNASVAIIGGDLTSSVAISTLVVESGFGQTIGTSSAYLQFDVGGAGAKTVILNNNTVTYLDIDTASLITVNRAAVGSTTEKGLNLVGTANTTIDIKVGTGSIGLAAQAGEAFTCATVNIWGGNVTIGSGATVTTLNVYGGNVTNYELMTTINQYGGTIDDWGGTATLNPFGGRYIWSHATDIATVGTIQGATIDFSTEETSVSATAEFTISAGTINDPHGRITDATVITLDNADVSNDGITLKLGKNRTLTLN